MKHIVAYSGGHSSALVAIEVARKFGKNNVVLLNHDISPKVEPQDVKRFKQEVANYLGLPITYANHHEWETETPISLCVKAGTWVNPANRTILCTNRLKTAPAFDWYEENYKDGDVVYFGFDANEPARVTRRSNLMGQAGGYNTDYPLALWKERTIHSTNEIGIPPPLSYDVFKHANCIGCLKAGWQHWYVIYCLYPHVWQQLLDGEEAIGFPMHGFDFAEDKARMFESMKHAGIEPTEKTPSAKFWARAKKALATQAVGQFNLFELPTTEKSAECTGDCRLT